MIKNRSCIDFWSIGCLNRPWPFIFIGWDGLIPQEILLQDLNLLKYLVVLGFYLDRSDRSTLPVRPLDPTGQTVRAYRSDRSVLSNANFSRQQCDESFKLSPWLNIIFQVTTKCATVSKPIIFHQINKALVIFFTIFNAPRICSKIRCNRYCRIFFEK